MKSALNGFAPYGFYKIKIDYFGLLKINYTVTGFEHEALPSKSSYTDKRYSYAFQQRYKIDHLSIHCKVGWKRPLLGRLLHADDGHYCLVGMGREQD